MNFHQVIFLQILFIILLIRASPLAAFSEYRGCSDTCGNFKILYPFGVGDGCYFDKGFQVRCDNSSGSPKPFLASINLELLEVNLTSYTVRVNVPVISWNCSRTSTANKLVDLSGSPFTLSDTYNRFTAIGCNNFATITNQNDSTVGACLSTCVAQPFPTNGCYGVRCCQTTIPPNLVFVNASVTSITEDSPQECRAAFMVDQAWFETNHGGDPYALRDQDYVPGVLEWGINSGTCFEVERENRLESPICGLDDNDDCFYPLGSRHLCLCNGGRSSISGGCQGRMICLNSPGGSSCSTCPDGYFSFQQTCFPRMPVIDIRPRVNYAIIIGCSTGLGVLLLLLGSWWLYKIVQRRKAVKLKQKYFRLNGGLLLQQQLLASNDTNFEKTKLFTSLELERATHNYHANRILGQGGQGTVYKGMLEDGKIVAVKKSKKLDEAKKGEFINEVVILSQINHRNVVKLLGCCLETEVPLLIYEFIPNGTLFQYLHEQNQEVPVTWEIRLRIAIEVANALAYLHSAASVPIYHRDIKSMNILLDEKFRAKVSDFGTSRTIAIDQTHLTTKVQGTFGYLDPEYFRSSQFTEKSDVYSFGVVVVELLTGQKPIRSIEFEEERSLAAYFLQAMKENRLFEVLDDRVHKEGSKEEIMRVANIARRCLNLNGKKRPTMREVSLELEGIKAANGGFTVQENYEEFDHYTDENITDSASERLIWK